MKRKSISPRLAALPWFEANQPATLEAAGGAGGFALYRQQGELFLVAPADGWRSQWVPPELDRAYLTGWERVDAIRRVLLKRI